jgi:hypothetical protein
VWKKKKEIGRAFTKYYKGLFRSQGPVRIEVCLQYVENKVCNSMNEQLLRPFTEEEINNALSQMHPLKSPGPDGYSAVFYKKFSPIVGAHVKKATLHFLNGGTFDASLNESNNVLIPKGNSPSRVIDYRPIS